MLTWFQKPIPKNRLETPLLQRLRLLLPAAVFVAMASAGFGQPASALIITNNSAEVESVEDVGLMFDVIYGCSGDIGGGTVEDCEAGTSTDLNADSIVDLGGSWWTITAFSDTSITFEIKIINSADDGVLSDFGVKVITPDPSGASLDNDGDLPWFLEVDTNFPGGFMTVDICLASTDGNCGGGGVSDGLAEGLMDTIILTLEGDWSSGILLEIFPSKFQSVGSGGESLEIEGLVILTEDPGFMIPEPASLLLFGIGLLGLGVFVRRRRFAA